MNNRTTISLCLLTWNEIDGCRMDVPQIPFKEFDEVFAVDGGSDDGTVEFLLESGIRVLKQPTPSLNAAYAYAYEVSDSEAVVFFHPKGTVPPSDLRRFRPFFDDGFDLVVASRNMRGATNEEDSRFLKPRKWFVSALAALLSLLWRREGNKIGDVLHGFRGMTQSAFQRIAPDAVGVTIDAEMVAGVYRHRLPRIEFPTAEQDRLHGSTHFKALPTGWRILKYVMRSLVRRYDRTHETPGTIPHDEDTSNLRA